MKLNSEAPIKSPNNPPELAKKSMKVWDSDRINGTICSSLKDTKKRLYEELENKIECQMNLRILLIGKNLQITALNRICLCAWILPAQWWYPRDYKIRPYQKLDHHMTVDNCIYRTKSFDIFVQQHLRHSQIWPVHKFWCHLFLIPNHV